MEKASDIQVGGGHYKDMPIQPWHFCQKNRIPYGESNVIKYVCRHRVKNGVEDLRKAIHNIEMIIEDEYGPEDGPELPPDVSDAGIIFTDADAEFQLEPPAKVFAAGHKEGG